MKLPIRRSVWPLLAGVLFSLVVIPARADEEVGGLTPVAGAAPGSDPLGELVDEAIRVSARRRLVANLHTPWQIVHGVLAYRQDFLIRDTDRDVPAIEWMTGGVSYKGEPWFEKTPYGGRAHTFTKPYIFEGHPNQFLALLSMSKLPRDFEFQTKDGPITIDGMIQHAKMTANTREEMTWTLWAFSHYVPHDARWHNKDGEPWSVERLIQKEIGSDVNRGACGGTHGLYALASARDAYLRETGQPLRGTWLAADQKVQQYVQITRMLQNPDGTFSTNYFAGRGNARDFDTVLVSNGHILEFLMRALPDERVNEEWVRRGVAALARGLIDYRNAPLDCGPLYHAVSGLTLYRERTRPNAPPLLADAVEKSATPMPPSSAAVNDAPRPVERPTPPKIATDSRESEAAEPRRVVPQPVDRQAEPRSVAQQPAVEDSPDSPERPRGLLSRIPLPFTPAAPHQSTGPRPSSDVPQPIPLPAPTVIAPRGTPPMPAPPPALEPPLAIEPPLAVEPPPGPSSVPPSLPPVDVAAIERQREEAAAREKARREQEEEARSAEVRKQREEARAAALRQQEEAARLAEERRKQQAENARLAQERRRQQEEEAKLAEQRRKQEEETRQAELKGLRLAADAKRAEADALAAEAAAQRAIVEAKQAETAARLAEAAVKQAEAEAKQAEAEARRLEAAAKQAEVEALRAEAAAIRQAAQPTESTQRE